MTKLLSNDLWSHVDAWSAVSPQEITAISTWEWDSVAQINKLDLIVICQYDILGLDISMSQTDWMKLMKSYCNFAENVAAVLVI